MVKFDKLKFLFLLFIFLSNIAYAALPGEKYLEEGGRIARIPASTAKIPAFAFEDCKSLEEVIFEANSRCIAIDEYAFWGCENLKKINLPPSVTTLGEGVFKNCRSLTVITLPERVRIIPAFCFSGCHSLKTVKFSSTLADIKRSAFIYCESLSEISLPPTLKHIGSNAFSRCLSLKEIKIPNSVSELESYAFSDCKSMTYAKLPALKNMLGELMFSGCKSLLILEEPSLIPPTFDCKSFIFEPEDKEAYERCTLIVPPGKENLYRNSQGWNLFENIESK